jgi:hypothetical protein
VDVDATVEATADAGGNLVPVFTRPPERSLDMALVVDGAPAMRIWDDTFDEFARLMAQTGAFRSVERWRLIMNGEVSLEDTSGKIQPTGRLIDPSGRRVVFVATNASADAWYTAGPWKTLASWCAAMPTALIQVLPRQYWAGTALGEPYITARASRPAAPNGKYARRLAWWAHNPGGMPLPVVTLAPDALENWAQAAVNGTVWTPGITAIPPNPDYVPLANGDVSADVLVNDFLSRASPGAERLARILATADTLSMPLIAVLQESLAPQTGVLELAETLSSGLLSVDGSGGQARFRFRTDTRQILCRGVTTFEEWDAYAAISRYLESRQRLGGPLSALVPDPDGSATLDTADEPFAALREALTTRLGLRAIPDGQGTAGENRLDDRLDRLLGLVSDTSDTSELSIPVLTPLVFEVSDTLVPVIDSEQDGGLFLFELLPAMRERIRTGLGVSVPGVRARGNPNLAPGHFTIQVDEVTITKGAAMVGGSYVLSPLGDEAPEPGAELTDTHPLFGWPGLWQLTAGGDDTGGAGTERLTLPQYLIHQIDMVFRGNLSCFVGLQEVASLVENWAQAEGDLIGSVLPDQGAAVRLTWILQSLVDERIPITEWRAILSGIRAVGGIAMPIRTLVRAARARLRAQLPGPRSGRRVLRVPELLQEAMARHSGSPPLPPKMRHEFQRWLREAVAAGGPALSLVAHDAEIREAVAALTRSHYRFVTTFTEEELASAWPPTTSG